MNITNIAKGTLLTFITGLTFVATAANAEHSTALFAGGDATNRSMIGYGGGVYAINGDVDGEGWLVRLFGVWGKYDYATAAVASNQVDATLVRGNLSGGYRMVANSFNLSGYVGVDYVDHSLSPDDLANESRGSTTGIFFQGEAVSNSNIEDYKFSLMANYSSANNEYWARGRAGYVFHDYSVTAGPEAVILGGNTYNSHRYGVFGCMPINDEMRVSASAGVARVNGKNARTDNGSGYVNLALSMLI